MRTADFDYELPKEYIAQRPVEPRDHARLFVLRRTTEETFHSFFYQLGEYLRPGDLLVLNETRVIPARLIGKKTVGGGRAEVLLLEKVDEITWQALVGGHGLVPGKSIAFSKPLQALIIENLGGAKRLVRFSEPVELYWERIGQVPLPPYIHAPLEDIERYQTVFARRLGSVAAPTAGLHFTPELMARLEEQGIRFAWITLHVGLDTFAPVTEESPEEHPIHSEWCELSEETARMVEETRRQGGRVIAVGTTSVRTLESAAALAPEGNLVIPFCGRTRLFILPGYRFRLVDAMITNFHLPRSTTLMLVSAFAGRERILAAYEEAKKRGYRFYSFGDAMLIL